MFLNELQDSKKQIQRVYGIRMYGIIAEQLWLDLNILANKTKKQMLIVGG